MVNFAFYFHAFLASSSNLVQPLQPSYPWGCSLTVQNVGVWSCKSLRFIHKEVSEISFSVPFAFLFVVSIFIILGKFPCFLFFLEKENYLHRCPVAPIPWWREVKIPHLHVQMLPYNTSWKTVCFRYIHKKFTDAHTKWNI